MMLYSLLILLFVSTCYADYIEDLNYKIIPELKTLIVAEVKKNSSKYKIPVEIIYAVIAVESSFKYDSVSNKNAIGLMQVNYDVWKTELQVTKKDLFKIPVNINAGTYILKKYLDKCSGDYECALNKYFGSEKHKYYEKVLVEIGRQFIKKAPSLN